MLCWPSIAATCAAFLLLAFEVQVAPLLASVMRQNLLSQATWQLSSSGGGGARWRVFRVANHKTQV